MTLTLTVDEMKLLATLASDQLFRREFIDPKMPGYKPDPREVAIGKALVVRLRSMVASQTPIHAGTQAEGSQFRMGGPRREM